MSSKYNSSKGVSKSDSLEIANNTKLVSDKQKA
jgi:hypothetical protein